MNDSIVIAPSFLERMIEHAQTTEPNECCGVLGGKGSIVTSVYPIENDHESSEKFFANPQELFQAVRIMRNSDEDMIGIYHSHPTSPPVPSDTDKRENHYPGIYYLIISLADSDPDVSCYVMNEEKQFESIQVV
jgi:proteasome lid subunit RPN8/RPN11